MRGLGTVFMFVAAAALILFPPCYHFATRGAWAKTVMGWHLMSFMGVLGAVMTFAVASAVCGPLPTFVRPLVWAAIAVVAWWRLILLFVVQHQDGRHPDE